MVKTFEDVVHESFEKGKRNRIYYQEALHYVENEAWLNKDGSFRNSAREVAIENTEKTQKMDTTQDLSKVPEGIMIDIPDIIPNVMSGGSSEEYTEEAFDEIQEKNDMDVVRATSEENEITPVETNKDDTDEVVIDETIDVSSEEVVLDFPEESMENIPEEIEVEFPGNGPEKVAKDDTEGIIPGIKVEIVKSDNENLRSRTIISQYTKGQKGDDSEEKHDDR